MSLEITNKDWIEFSSTDNGMCILDYNLNKLVKPKNEDVDIGFIVMILKSAIEVSNQNTGSPKYIARINLRDTSIFNLQIGTIIKVIRTLQKEIPDTICDIIINDVEDKYIFIWNGIKSFIDKETLHKIKIYTCSGKLISVENLEKNLSK